MKKISLIITFITISYVNFAQSQFWGGALAGSTANAGLIFKTDNSGSNQVTVKSFTTNTDGSIPKTSRLVQATNGKLYGLTNLGGVNNLGVLYEYDPVTSIYTKKIDFDGVNGKAAKGSLMQAADGKLYGLTNQGGTSSLGDLFQYDYTTNIITKKVDFTGLATGSYPYGSLFQASDGNLYGTTQSGGGINNNAGVIFQYNTSTNTFTKKLDFENELMYGYEPLGTLMQATDGKLYGVTSMGGVGQKGVLFQFDYSSNILVKKHNFSDGTEGARFSSSLIQANNGKIYGMTTSGGDYSSGVIFQIDPSTNAYVKKYDFNNLNGVNPQGALLQASDGKFYGLTSQGGTYNLGTLFQYDDATNTYTVKVHFRSQGNTPRGALIQGIDGKLYGLTSLGGTSNQGVLFKYDPVANTYTNVVNFTGPNGSIPKGTLMQASNGMIYGLTYEGGVNNVGVLFQYNPVTNAFAKRIDFSAGLNGANPYGSLIEGPTGMLYGLTAGGSISSGSIFSYNISTNAITRLYAFGPSAGGVDPRGSLLLASDNNLYGTTYYGGTNNYGILFQYNPTTNTYTKKTDFVGTNGSYPLYTKLIEVKTINLAAVTLTNCAGSSINIPYSIAEVFNSGNVFTAQLSDASGSFVSAVNIGTITSTAAGTINAIIPSSVTAGTGYRVRIVSSNPSITSFDNGSNLIIGNPTINVNSGSICVGDSYTIVPSGAVSYTYSGGTSVVTPTSTTVYSVSGADVNGCISIANSSVTVNQLPLITVNSGSICSGGTFTMTPSGANTYSYSSGSNTVTPVNNSSYTVTGTDANGCVNSSISTVSVNTTANISPISGNATSCYGSSYVYSITPISDAINYNWILPTELTGSAVNTNSISVSPSSNALAVAVLSVNVTNICGVSSTQTLSIYVSTPSSQFISSQNTVCANSSATISATDDNANIVNYTWSTATQTICSSSVCNTITDLPSSTTTYSLTVTDVYNCSQTYSYTINTIPTPTVLATTSNTLICNGNSATLTATGANSYAWSSGSTTDTDVVSPTTLTDYTVTGSGLNGCSSEAVVTVSVSLCTGIESLDVNDNIVLYPNPTNGILNVKTITPDTKINIYNALSELVLSEALLNIENQINLNELSKGIYIVKITSNNRTISVSKIVKE